MTLDDAILAAKQLANDTGKAVEVWEHTGGPKAVLTEPPKPGKGKGKAKGRTLVVPAALPQHRFIARPKDKPPPRHNRWTRRLTVQPEGSA